jgi:dTDP-4-amino-4,6-dideoxygalactose transaminase
MKIPFIDLHAVNEPYFIEYQKQVQEILKSCSFILSSHVEEFENAFAHYLGVKHVVSLNSGTDALIFALRCAGVGPGDEVITVPLSFYATLEAILHVGATPVFVDVEADTALMNVTQVPRKISPRTKAILPVHLCGQPVAMDPLLDIAHQHKLAIIEDACQAHGSFYNDKKVGTLGDFGCFSFYPSKNLGGFGDGGALVTNNDQAAEMARKLRNHGSLHKVSFELLGYNSRLDSLQAAILGLKLQSLDACNARRATAAALYHRELAKISWAQPLKQRPDCVSNNHLFVIRVPSAQRARIHNQLNDAGVETRIYYDQPLHKMPILRGRCHENYPITENLCQTSLALPLHDALTNADGLSVVQALTALQL